MTTGVSGGFEVGASVEAIMVSVVLPASTMASILSVLPSGVTRYATQTTMV